MISRTQLNPKLRSRSTPNFRRGPTQSPNDSTHRNSHSRLDSRGRLNPDSHQQDQYIHPPIRTVHNLEEYNPLIASHTLPQPFHANGRYLQLGLHHSAEVTKTSNPRGRLIRSLSAIRPTAKQNRNFAHHKTSELTPIQLHKDSDAYLKKTIFPALQTTIISSSSMSNFWTRTDLHTNYAAELYIS